MTAPLYQSCRLECVHREASPIISRLVARAVIKLPIYTLFVFTIKENDYTRIEVASLLRVRLPLQFLLRHLVAEDGSFVFSAGLRSPGLLISSGSAGKQLEEGSGKING